MMIINTVSISQEAAEAAKKRGKILRQGLPPVEIFWKQQGKRRSTTSGICDQSVCLVHVHILYLQKYNIQWNSINTTTFRP